ncbi:hypothetical protein JEP98_05935 [Providencia rettgeri]|uniref:hypothetical protein n=1 Tax=Providencia rettgeri TaxID=587 RepID=UPI0018E44BED|nr:hypothetical protein [Providencia rettgeri]MBI6188699.1 hypothetical protein [Providencia rettgeri]
MEFKGSKAPWNYDGNIRGAVEGSIDDLVASVYPMHYENAEEMKANAHLIAAAPELLQALQLIISYHDDGNVGLYYEDLALARKAIANASGQQ